MDPLNTVSSGERARKEAETLVFWDINNCPVPEDCEAGLVGSCIKTALRKEGHCKGDHVSISAIVDIYHPSQPNGHVFTALFSTGIRVLHSSRGITHDIDDLLRCGPKIPCPATVMIITGDAHVKHVTDRFPRLRSKGYTPLLAYPVNSKVLTSEKSYFWETFVKEGFEERSRHWRQEIFQKMFSCKLCSVDGRTFEDLTTHLKSRDHLERTMISTGETETETETETWVLWDIDTCTVPKDCDARMVGLGIESALKKAGVSGGPLTITAIGNLKYTLQLNPDVLPAIFSTGIRLRHSPRGFRDFFGQLRVLLSHKPLPVTLMILSRNDNYSFMLQDQRPEQPLSMINSDVFLWETLMKDALDSGETRRDAYKDKDFESTWFCSLCGVGFLPSMTPGAIFCPINFCGESSQGKRFKDFAEHIKCREHAIKELGLVRSPKSIDIKLFGQIKAKEEESEDKSEDESEDEDDEDEDIEISVSVNDDDDDDDDDDDEEWDQLSV